MTLSAVVAAEFIIRMQWTEHQAAVDRGLVFLVSQRLAELEFLVWEMMVALALTLFAARAAAARAPKVAIRLRILRLVLVAMVGRVTSAERMSGMRAAAAALF